ncbi:ESX secretion-associated protein EspG [Actinophytocola sediminis]
MVLASPLILSTEALARLVRAENLGDLHIALRPLARWRPAPVRERLETEDREEFARLGLLDARHRPDPELLASLTALCRPGAEFYGWINEGDKTRSVLAAATGREAVLAIRDGDTVMVNQIRPDALPEVLVAQTPEVRPARGDTFTVLRSELLSSAGGRHRAEASTEVRAVQQVIAQPTTGGGELYVAVRDRAARRRAVPYPLRYADTEGGRWLNHMTDAPNGDHRVLIAPATRTDLVRRLQDLHRTLLG